MSILDGLPKDEKQIESAIHAVALLSQQLATEMGHKEGSLLDLLGKGLSIADIMEIPGDQLDTLFATACRLLDAGQTDKARDLFAVLCQLQPLEERYTYGLASAYQIEGDYRTAGRLYVLFLALDATNIEGRLRLAECFLGAGEYDNAASMFGSVVRDAGTGEATPENGEYARRMIARCELLKSGSLQ
jgi:tetratricopeptide (TPR) repeat protein